jgi:NADH-quinone oxidoreductase subunit M
VLVTFQQTMESLVEHSVFLLFVLPLVGAVLVAVSSSLGLDVIRRTALTNVLLSSLISALMIANYEIPEPTAERPTRLLQMASESGSKQKPNAEARTPNQTIKVSPKPSSQWGIRVAVGVDGFSVWFAGSVAFLMIPATLSHWNTKRKPALFFVLLLILQAALVGVFAALDIILFYVCLEVAVLAMFFLVGEWGEKERRKIAVRFFIYQFIGSLLIFLGLIALVLVHSWATSGNSSGREFVFSITRLMTELPRALLEYRIVAESWQFHRGWIVVPLILGFAIKLSLFPLHRWLPTTFSEAPSGTGILMFGSLVNVGIYGCLRFLLPLFQVTDSSIPDTIVIWALSGLVIAGLLAIAQNNMQRLIAYAVASHTGFCLAGLCSLNSTAITGAIFRAVSQGLCLGGLAFLLAAIRQRYETTKIDACHGIATRFPRLSLCFLLFVLASIAIPGTGGFVGTLTVLAGISLGSESVSQELFWFFTAILSPFLVAVAMIWMLQRLFESDGTKPTEKQAPSIQISGKQDLSWAECASLAPLLTIVIWMGIFPQYIIARTVPSVDRFLQKKRQADERSAFSDRQKAKKKTDQNESVRITAIDGERVGP